MNNKFDELAKGLAQSVTRRLALKREFSRAAFKVLVALGLFAEGAASTQAQSEHPNPRIIPPNAVYDGHTYSEWQARAYQWQFSIPAPVNPTLPGNEAFIANGQPKHVWFILTYGTGGHFTVPAGKALYVFIIDQFVDNFLCQDPPTTYTLDQLRAIAAGSIDPFGDFQVSIVKDVQQYRTVSPPFFYTLCANNLAEYFGCSNGPGTYGPGLTDGYHLLLPPPPVGEHLIDEKMVQHVVPGDPSQDVHLEFIFQITVVPRRTL
jgi:hypothetical protein